MSSNPMLIETEKVEAYPVSEHARMGTLPRHFAKYMMLVEGRVYDLMSEFCSDYGGGIWQFYELSNGGFYMAPRLDRARLHVPSNGYAGEMSADAAGIMACLFAFSLLSFEYPQAPVFGRHFYWLRDYALGHEESTEIFKAID